MSNYSDKIQILTNQDGSTNFNSEWVDVTGIDFGSLQIYTTDALTGVLKLQCTNDKSISPADISESIVEFEGNGSQVWSFPFGFGFKFLRISWEFGSGTGTFNANIFQTDDE